MLTALTSQLEISNNHLLKKLFEALYSASFLSNLCVKSRVAFSLSEDWVELRALRTGWKLDPRMKWRNVCWRVSGVRS